MMRRRGLVRWSRVAIAAAVGLMAIVLVTLGWSSERSVHAASRTVVRGEAVGLAAALRGRLADAPDQPLATRLAAAVEAMRGDGVLYAAVLGGGRIDAEAGHASIDAAGLVQWARAAQFNVPTGDIELARSLTRRPRSLGGTGGATPPRGEGILIEFRPRIAGELHEISHRNLVIQVLAATTLIGIAIALIVWSLRREAVVRSTEQARHLAHLGQMSAVLAHEIRNPLASLKGNAQLLAQGL